MLIRGPACKVAYFFVQVFDDADASDPSHSLLSKVSYIVYRSSCYYSYLTQDHFALILNEPAGKIALVVVQHSVKLLVDVCTENGSNETS